MVGFLAGTPTPVVNYDYADISEGTGTQVFYGTHSMEDTTDDYILSKTAEPANHIETKEVVTVNSSWFMPIDLDFDLSPFALPNSIVGTARVSVPFRIEGIGGSAKGYVKARLRKWDSVEGETEIAVGQSEEIDGSDDIRKFLVKMTVPLTHFKKGNILRLTIEGWGWASGTTNILVAHDPQARTTTLFPGSGTYKVTTDLKAFIPFKMNI